MALQQSVFNFKTQKAEYRVLLNHLWQCSLMSAQNRWALRDPPTLHICRTRAAPKVLPPSKLT